ncbi:gluconate 5-dehydrogenase [Bradyrhizobium sp. CCBAU 53351]|uniref:SDR family oxidoreductase n=1 Tax=Bradyrhizobium sp. CCBAU 53351 TaxID=1325114 RepID=UPI00188906D5|nr:SDR family oxidoreductase [Bradyrhizobium sp. CCBAU 53351]QOZ77705.1 gluconate 5-dehydrogenase [Bradyrhizobium sp. CCBAU 53351]
MKEEVGKLFDLKGRTALVTGGSRGLGLQVAEVLGDLGAQIVLSARSSEELSATSDLLAKRGISVEWVAADASRDSDIEALADKAIEKLGHVDILVNNAGASWGAPAEDHPIEAWDKVFNLNVRGLFLLTQKIGKRSMIPRNRGRIINMASIAGLIGNPPGTHQTIAYNTSKGAVVNFTRALAAEWGPRGITVNAIAPGFFPSKMSNGVLKQIGDRVLQDTPLGRLGGDEDLKGAVALFASEAGRHITGQILAVDGGATAV